MDLVRPKNKTKQKPTQIWNIKGATKNTIPHLIKDLILKYHIDLLALLETIISGVKANKVIKNENGFLV
ncbi:hypothetical protein CR513_27865, partial [Mucuna pruriens]